MSASRWVPGLRFGPEFDPDQYELLQFHHRGGEAEVWRAVRTGHSGVRELVAAKIMLERDPSEVRRWLGRWDDVAHNAHHLGGITDLVIPKFLLGPDPHQAGRRPRGDTRGYQIAPWVEGVSLNQWARDHRGGLLAAGDVLVRLCRIVDELHRQRWVHRDISPNNVLVAADGGVKLIDLTFLASLDHPLSVAVYTPGHVPPENEQVGKVPAIAKDVYAVGTLARGLLLPEHGPVDPRVAVEQTRRELIAAGFGEELAAWVCEALDQDPDVRPSPLGPWALRGRELLRVQRTMPRIACLAVVPDRDGEPLVVAGGADGIAFVGPGALPEELPPAGVLGPRTVRGLVAGRTGPDAELTLYVEDGIGTLWVGTGSGWWESARGASGLAGGVDRSGELVVWTAIAGSLRSARWPQEHTHAGGARPKCPADRVLAAVAEPSGSWLVLVEHRNRVLCWELGNHPPVEHPGPAGPVLAAALARTSGGSQATVLSHDGSAGLHSMNIGTGTPPSDVGEPESALSVAMAGHRGGPTIALAGRGGVRVGQIGGPAGAGGPGISGLGTGTGTRTGAAASDDRRARWWRPTLRPATRVALTAGEDWRITLAAVVEDEIHCWREDARYHWQAVDLDAVD